MNDQPWRRLLKTLASAFGHQTVRLDLQTPFTRQAATPLHEEIRQRELALLSALRRHWTEPPRELNGFVRQPRPVRPFLRTGRVAVPEPEELSVIEATEKNPCRDLLLPRSVLQRSSR